MTATITAAIGVSTSKDQWRLRKLADLGWVIIRVIAEDKPQDIIERVRRALIARGCRLEGRARVPLAG